MSNKKINKQVLKEIIYKLQFSLQVFCMQYGILKDLYDIDICDFHHWKEIVELIQSK